MASEAGPKKTNPKSELEISRACVTKIGEQVSRHSGGTAVDVLPSDQGRPAANNALVL